MVPLNQLYKSILISLGKHVADDGKISHLDGDNETTPAMLMEKRLTLATVKVLDASPWNELIAFHPVSENVTLNESQIQSWIRGSINERITTAIVMLLTSALVVAANPSIHPKLKARQKKFLSVIPDVSDDLLHKWERAAVKINAHKAHRVFNLYLTKAGEMDSLLYQRLASVSFPIMNDLTAPSVRTDAQGKNINEYKIFDVKFQKGEWETIRDLFLYFFPDAATENGPSKYSVGSNSATAPFFDASIRAYLKMAELLNGYAETYDGAFDISDICIDTSWAAAFDNLATYRNQIPNNLEGNDGVHPFKQKDLAAELKNGAVRAAQERPVPTSTQPVSTPVVAAAAPVVAPVVAPLIVPGQRDNGQSFREATTTGAPGEGLSHLRRNMGQNYLGHPSQVQQQPKYQQHQQWPQNQATNYPTYGARPANIQPPLGTAARAMNGGAYGGGGYPMDNRNDYGYDRRSVI